MGDSRSFISLKPLRPSSLHSSHQQVFADCRLASVKFYYLLSVEHVYVQPKGESSHNCFSFFSDRRRRVCIGAVCTEVFIMLETRLSRQIVHEWIFIKSMLHLFYQSRCSKKTFRYYRCEGVTRMQNACDVVQGYVIMCVQP